MKRTKVQTRRQVLSLLRAHRDILRNCKVKKIGLFGSFARGEQRSRSDIDFLVEFTKPSFDNLLELHEQLTRIYGRKIELVTPNGMSKYIKPFVEKEVRWHEVK